MKTKHLLPAIPQVFSLRGNDYSSFVVHGGASAMMRDTWIAIGQRLNKAANKVGPNGQKKAA